MLFILMGVFVLIDLEALVIGCRSRRAQVSLHVSVMELRSDELMRMAALIVNKACPAMRVLRDCEDDRRAYKVSQTV
jgi:hypothetical protein